MRASFLKDDAARVPFAVIGIFLILISTITSINLARQDINMAKTMSSNLEVTAADTALQYAWADIARAINYGGLEALKKIGEAPVVQPYRSSEYFRDGGEPDGFNKNRARAMIRNTLNRYIEANYMYDTFAYNGFSVNVEPLDSWKIIKIEPVTMGLGGRLSPPVLPPGKGKYESYETYWKVTVPLKVHLVDLKTKSGLLSKDITVETIITSRYPLIKDLTDEYGERLNGTNAVMAETTAFALAYTWARGYMQYATGGPENIVENAHLSLITNGALLLDQGFVFNSVDPMSIVEYANQTALTISGQNKKYQEIALEGGAFRIDPQKDAFNSTGDPRRAEEEFNRAKKFDYNATPIADFINNKTLVNRSMVALKIKDVSEKVYSATIKTIMERSSDITPGDHPGHPVDKMDRDEDRVMHSHSDPVKDEALSSAIKRDPNLSPGVIYGEVWRVNWVTDHKWWKTWTELINGELYSYHHEMMVKDYQNDTVTFKLYAVWDSPYDLMLNYAKTTRRTDSDINNAFIRQNVSYRSQHEDNNLEDALEKYKSVYFSEQTIKNRILDFDREFPEGAYQLSESGSYEPWLEEEAQAAVDDIRNMINDDVHLDPDINHVTYPIQSDLLAAAKEDMIRKIERNESRYVDKARYMANNRYNSASAKVISLVREWYVDEIKYQISKKFDEAIKKFDDEMEKGFRENTGNVKNANRNATRFLSGGMNLPLGLAMTAYHVDEKGGAYPEGNLSAWSESVTLSINQEPDFLDPDTPYGEEKLYTLKLRNANLMTPYGLWLLPAMNPWIMTVNAWEINVEGEFVKFEVHDIDNEVHPDPIFGHAAAVYVRKQEFGVIDAVTGLPIGNNLPIKFSFTTGTFIAVPPGKMGVGDRKGDKLGPLGFIDESIGWNV